MGGYAGEGVEDLGGGEEVLYLVEDGDVVGAGEDCDVGVLFDERGEGEDDVGGGDGALVDLCGPGGGVGF